MQFYQNIKRGRNKWMVVCRKKNFWFGNGVTHFLNNCMVKKSNICFENPFLNILQ